MSYIICHPPGFDLYVSLVRHCHETCPILHIQSIPSVRAQVLSMNYGVRNATGAADIPPLNLYAPSTIYQSILQSSQTWRRFMWFRHLRSKQWPGHRLELSRSCQIGHLTCIVSSILGGLSDLSHEDHRILCSLRGDAPFLVSCGKCRISARGTSC